MDVVWVGNGASEADVSRLAGALGSPATSQVRPADEGTLRALVESGSVDTLCGALAPDVLAHLRQCADDIAFVALGTGDERRDLALLEAGADEVVPPEPNAVEHALARARARRDARRAGLRPRERHNVALELVAERMRACANAPARIQVRVLAEVSADALCVARTSIWLFDERRSELRPFDVYDARTKRHLDGTRLRAEDYPAYFAVLRQARVIAANDAHTHPATRDFSEGYLKPLGIGAMLDAPVRVGEHVLGVLCHEHVGGPRRWTAEDRSIAAGIADFVALAIEMHEHRRAEERLKRSQEALEQSRRIEAVGRLASGVAHDFNNMLTVIMSYAEILRRKLGEGNALTPIANEIARAGHHASDMTRKLLAVSRREHARPRTLELGPVLRDMEQFLHRLIGEDVELVLDLGDEAVFVEADPGQLEQLLLNLAVNARDAMPAGGALTISVRATEDAAILSVRDTGSGMSAEVKARIFEPFFTTKPPGRGTGLGLFTVFGIVQESRGTIDVQSAPGEGTTFEVRLPRRARPVDTTTAGERRRPTRGSETILLVEDEEAVAAVVCAMLKELGYDVMLACGGEEALELARRHQGPLDLLVTDVVMPGMSGPVLARRLRAERPGVRVLFVSGYADDALERYGAASVKPLLAKPFTRDALGAKVREVLDSGGRPLEARA